MLQTAALGWCQLLTGALGVWVSRHLAVLIPGTQTEVQHLTWQESLDNSRLLFTGEKAGAAQQQTVKASSAEKHQRKDQGEKLAKNLQ